MKTIFYIADIYDVPFIIKELKKHHNIRTKGIVLVDLNSGKGLELGSKEAGNFMATWPNPRQVTHTNGFSVTHRWSGSFMKKRLSCASSKK